MTRRLWYLGEEGLGGGEAATKSLLKNEKAFHSEPLFFSGEESHRIIYYLIFFGQS
jgi:hypothetical protein